MITPGQELVTIGSATLTNRTLIEIYLDDGGDSSTTPIQVTDILTLGGTLSIILEDTPVKGSSRIVATAGSIQGKIGQTP